MRFARTGDGCNTKPSAVVAEDLFLRGARGEGSGHCCYYIGNIGLALIKNPAPFLMRGFSCRRLLHVDLLNEVFDFLFGFFLGVAVLLLDQTSQLLEAAADAVQVIIGQFSPGLLGFTAHLLPLTCQYISIESYVHGNFLSLTLAIVERLSIRAKHMRVSAD
jgi:hypothetical protein